MNDKPETITIRVATEFKRLVKERAREHQRSITNYIEWLVTQDAAKTEPKHRRG